MKDAKGTEAENQSHQLRHTTLDLNINKQNSESLLSSAFVTNVKYQRYNI